MTVEEFYQQQYGEGKVEVGGGGKTEEEGEQEEEEEEESEADLKKARDWDDFKDGRWTLENGMYTCSHVCVVHRQQERMGQQKEHGLDYPSPTLRSHTHANIELSLTHYRIRPTCSWVTDPLMLANNYGDCACNDLDHERLNT